MMPSNIQQLKREALAQRVTWDFGPETLPVKPAPEGWARRVLADIREADEDEAAELAKAVPMSAFEIRCPICHAHSAAGHACMHRRRA